MHGVINRRRAFFSFFSNLHNEKIMKSFIKLFILLITAVSLNAADLNIKNIKNTHNSISFTISNDDEKNDFLLAIRPIEGNRINPDNNFKYIPNTKIDPTEEKSRTGYNNFVVYIGKIEKNKPFELTGLDPQTEYFLDLYIKVDNEYDHEEEFQVYTLAEPPSMQTRNVFFGNNSTESFLILVNKGSGEGRMIICKKESPITFIPKQGHVYEGSPKYGDGQKLDDGSFVIANAGKGNLGPVLNLEPGTEYFVAAFEYNGDGKYRNYNDSLNEKQNINSRITVPLPPEALEPYDMTESSFMVHWKPTKGAIAYAIDVAKDEDFEEPLEYYNNLDVNDATDWFIDGVEKGKTYYFRVYAFAIGGKSEYSNVVEIEVK